LAVLPSRSSALPAPWGPVAHSVHLHAAAFAVGTRCRRIRSKHLAQSVASGALFRFVLAAPFAPGTRDGRISVRNVSTQRSPLITHAFKSAMTSRSHLKKDGRRISLFIKGILTCKASSPLIDETERLLLGLGRYLNSQNYQDKVGKASK